MTLAHQLSKHFCMINSRLTTFVGIIKSMLLRRGVTFRNLSEEIDSVTKHESKIKAISRFLNGNHIPDEQLDALFRNFIPKNKVIVSIDRTIWEMGSSIRNILVLAVSYDGIAMPIMFKMLSYKGACTANDKIEMIARFIEKFGIEKIAAIVGDREFDGEKFMTYLDTKKIPYVLRVRKRNCIVNEMGKKVRISTLGQTELTDFKTQFYKANVKINHLITKSGDQLALISSLDIKNPLCIYKKRWDIETAFKGCKTNGFRMEETHITNPIRLENLIKCIFIACAIAIKIGGIAHQKNPIKIKKTLQCKKHSLLKLGFRFILEAYTAARGIFHMLLKLVFKIEFITPPEIFVR